MAVGPKREWLVKNVRVTLACACLSSQAGQDPAEMS